MRNTILSLMPIVIACLVIVAVYLGLQLNRSNSGPIESVTNSTSDVRSSEDSDIQNINCVPTFRDGGGPYYVPNSPFRSVLSPEFHNGESLTVTGKLLRRDCVTPVTNAVIDIWQANESGRYDDEWYRGRIRTDSEGNYRFETVVPKGYGEGTGYRPPHIHFKVIENNVELVTSQMFFPDVTGRFEDAYIMEVETSDVNGIKSHQGTHNIILP